MIIKLGLEQEYFYDLNHKNSQTVLKWEGLFEKLLKYISCWALLVVKACIQASTKTDFLLATYFSAEEHYLTFFFKLF